MTMQTEFEFELPRGYLDGYGALHKQGTMRLSTAIDEIAPLRDPRVQANEAYFLVAVLARVITRLGTIIEVTPQIVERLFAADIAYLQDFYQRINDVGLSSVPARCPNCGYEFEQEIIPLGGSEATP
ncbi:MAG: phage tail assembly protein [Anaerolineae bacterium]|nr:phage tail assembly protein [Anaerolineae bacterium]